MFFFFFSFPPEAIHERQTDWARNAAMMSDAIGRAGIAMSTDMQKKLDSLLAQQEKNLETHLEEVKVYLLLSSLDELETDLKNAKANKDETQRRLSVTLQEHDTLNSTCKGLIESIESTQKEVRMASEKLGKLKSSELTLSQRLEEAKTEVHVSKSQKDTLVAKKERIDGDIQAERLAIQNKHEKIKSRLDRFGHENPDEAGNSTASIGRAVEISSRVVTNQQKELSEVEKKSKAYIASIEDISIRQSQILEQEVEFAKELHSLKVEFETISTKMGEFNMVVETIGQLSQDLKASTDSLLLLKRRQDDARLQKLQINTQHKDILRKTQLLSMTLAKVRGRRLELLNRYKDLTTSLGLLKDEVTQQGLIHDEIMTSLSIQLAESQASAEGFTLELERMDVELDGITSKMAELEAQRQSELQAKLRLAEETEETQNFLIEQCTHAKASIAGYEERITRDGFKTDSELQALFREKIIEFSAEEKKARDKTSALQKTVGAISSVLVRARNLSNRELVETYLAMIEAELSMVVDCTLASS